MQMPLTEKSIYNCCCNKQFVKKVIYFLNRTNISDHLSILICFGVFISQLIIVYLTLYTNIISFVLYWFMSEYISMKGIFILNKTIKILIIIDIYNIVKLFKKSLICKCERES